MIGDQQDFFNRLKTTLPRGWFDGNTPVVDTVLGGIASVLATIYSTIAGCKALLRVTTATGGMLDMMAGDFFGDRLLRRAGESDDDYRWRIKVSIFRNRGTRAAMIFAVRSLVNDTPDIVESMYPKDTLGLGVMGLNVAGHVGTRVPGQAFVTVYRGLSPVSDSAIYSAVNNTRAYATSVWVQIKTSRSGLPVLDENTVLDEVILL